MLWADSDPWGGVWAVVAGVGGSLLTGVGAWVLQYMSARGQQQTAARREALDEAYKLIDRMRQDFDRAEAKVAAVEGRLEEMRADHEACKLRYERAIARIDALEEALAANKVPFRPWKPDPDTAEHRPLGPAGNPPGTPP